MTARKRRVLRLVLPPVLASALLSRTAGAHVRYVTEGAGESIPLLALLRTLLSDPVDVAILLGGGVAVVAAASGYLYYRPFNREVTATRSTLHEYSDLVPWLLRLSVGLPLVGAGFQGYFFTPAVHVHLRLFQIALGFAFLFGFVTRLAAVAGLVAYLVGAVFAPQMLLASEFVGGMLAIAILGGGRPSADQMFQHLASLQETRFTVLAPVTGTMDSLTRFVQPYEAYAPTVVRVCLGVNFLVLGLFEKVVNAGRAMQVVAKYELTAVVPVAPELWVVGAGLAEALIGGLLLVGLFTRAVSGVSFGMFTLTLFAIPDDPVLAHVSLFGLVSVLLVTGSGRLGLDELLSRSASDREPSVGGASVGG